MRVLKDCFSLSQGFLGFFRNLKTKKAMVLTHGLDVSMLHGQPRLGLPMSSSLFIQRFDGGGQTRL
jgi:hypothetical protein